MLQIGREKSVYLFGLGIAFLFLVWLLTPPKSFPTGSIITISEGSGLYALSEELREQHVIRSPFWFRATAIILGGERRMQAGQYFLEHRETAFSFAWRVLHGKHNIETVKVTIPEGFTVERISKLFDNKFTFFDNTLFEKTAPEGYLFPDTYFIPVTATASSTIKLLRDNFVRKIFDVMPEVEKSGKSLETIITMASLVEAEGKTEMDRLAIAAILWKRLKLGMPLQVDSEMGTYEFAGLPETPINNPGLMSITATLRATSTPYLYFLTGKDGKMHYAKTFDEHKANIAKYLPN